MMNSSTRRKQIESAERRVLRDRREDAAGRLLLRVPDLTSLSIVIHEARPNGCVSDTQYVRHIVLEHAAALFEVPCSYAYCEDGGYDVTREMLFALGLRRVRVEGEQACGGRCKVGDCGRVLRYVATAAYRIRPSAEPWDGAVPMRPDQ
jgi:hypothetical protein